MGDDGDNWMDSRVPDFREALSSALGVGAWIDSEHRDEYGLLQMRSCGPRLVVWATDDGSLACARVLRLLTEVARRRNAGERHVVVRKPLIADGLELMIVDASDVVDWQGAPGWRSDDDCLRSLLVLITLVSSGPWAAQGEGRGIAEGVDGLLLVANTPEENRAVERFIKELAGARGRTDGPSMCSYGTGEPWDAWDLATVVRAVRSRTPELRPDSVVSSVVLAIEPLRAARESDSTPEQSVHWIGDLLLTRGLRSDRERIAREFDAIREGKTTLPDERFYHASPPGK